MASDSGIKKQIKDLRFVKVLQKSTLYARLRAQLPGGLNGHAIDDRGQYPAGQDILIDWPADLPKPRVAVMKDFDPYPRWTKYIHFLETNGFPYGLFDLHAQDWLEQARHYDVFIGLIDCELSLLMEMRKKFFILERYMGKICYPSWEHVTIYEDKTLESYISEITGIPFAKAHISHNEADALAMIETLSYPTISKFETSSGSMGVELVHSKGEAERIVRKSFSVSGRASHLLYHREKNYCYFQDFIPNDGYDIRCIVVDNMVFGYYRKVLEGDFRASGMNLVEKRDLPEEAIRIAWRASKVLKSPLMVVDMMHGLDGQYYVIEYSINCQMETPEQLHVDGQPGVYIIDEDESIHFQPGRYWVHELALRQFFIQDYLPRHVQPEAMKVVGYE